MISDSIYDILTNELQRQEQLLATARRELAHAPEGYLYLRDTGRNLACYQVLKKQGEIKEHRNISGNTILVNQLLAKAKNKRLQKLCRNNIQVIKRTLKTYSPVTVDTLFSEKQHRMQQMLFHPPAYKKAAFDPNAHIHETMYGELVRSKSEVIIANALWHFGIPFNYEELFPYPDEDGNWFFPDFTIHCPDGTVIIWEHWGMLDKHTYCVHNAGKLHTYNQNNYVIGKNLIITQDDIQGNCSAPLIYHIIETYILPHFQ